MIGLPGDYSYQWRERQLLVMITAEGPTCVLTIADLQVFTPHLLSPAAYATRTVSLNVTPLKLTSWLLLLFCLQKHEISAADELDSRHGDRLGWQPWSSPVTSKAPASQTGTAVAAALHADVSLLPSCLIPGSAMKCPDRLSMLISLVMLRHVGLFPVVSSCVHVQGCL